MKKMLNFTLMGPPPSWPVAESGTDRLVLNKMKSHSGGQNGEWCAAEHTPLNPTKIFGVLHCLEDSETFSAPSEGASQAGVL